jgi:hypothetical protein
LSTNTTNTLTAEDELEIKAIAAKITPYVHDAIQAFVEGPPTDEAAHKLVNFVIAVTGNPDDVESLFLEYVSDDPAKGREIISKLGNLTLQSKMALSALSKVAP